MLHLPCYPKTTLMEVLLVPLLRTLLNRYRPQGVDEEVMIEVRYFRLGNLVLHNIY